MSDLSVVIAIVSDTTTRKAGVEHLQGCLEALSAQAGAPPMEVIVPHHEDVDGIGTLERQFPSVRFLPVTGLRISSRKGGGREHHDIIRARGIAAARGDVVALIEDYARPHPEWAQNVVGAHRDDVAAVGGAIENGIDRPLNWAVYFCDFGRYQNPLPAGESSYASDANVSYKRSALESIRTIWEESFREVIVNQALRARGEKVALRPDIVIFQQRSDLHLGLALRERFVWGRSYAATRNALLGPPKRLVYAALSPLLPAILVLRMTRTAWERRSRIGKFLRAFHLIVLLQVGWALGEGAGYLMGVRPHDAADAG